MKKYEGMFLFDPSIGDWEKIKAELDRLMERAEARMIASGKWDECRLAYEIRGQKRGIYALVYFEAPPSNITALERDVQLAESILRCLILRADHLTEDQMKEVLACPGPRPAPDKGPPAVNDDKVEETEIPRFGRKGKPAASAVVNTFEAIEDVVTDVN